jgi:hypothetical protein
MRKISNPPGPAAAWMIEAFRSTLTRCPNMEAFKAQLPSNRLDDAIAAE